MSKSLKNFTTIRAMLSGDEWSARSLRICFLLKPWKDKVELTDGLLKEVVSWEDKINSFFLKSLDISRHPRPEIATGKEPDSADHQLLRGLGHSKSRRRYSSS